MLHPLDSAIASLRDLHEDSSVTKNIQTKILEIITILEAKGEPSLRASRAVCVLEQITDNSSMESYTRTQLFNVLSILSGF